MTTREDPRERIHEFHLMTLIPQRGKRTFHPRQSTTERFQLPVAIYTSPIRPLIQLVGVPENWMMNEHLIIFLFRHSSCIYPDYFASAGAARQTREKWALGRASSSTLAHCNLLGFADTLPAAFDAVYSGSSRCYVLPRIKPFTARSITNLLIPGRSRATRRLYAQQIIRIFSE